MLRLSELYTSVQGEGPRVGTLTQFVRFAGCNMRCPGWPCDTQHAIQPALYLAEGGSKQLEPGVLAEKICDAAYSEGSINICFTGGEPFLQKKDQLHDLCMELEANRDLFFTFEVFTNGSFEFPTWTKREMDMLFMMDWKLRGSGEAQTNRAQRVLNAKHLEEEDGVKFVIKDEDDLAEAVAVTVLLDTKRYKGRYWVGRCWDAEITDADLIDFTKQMGMPWSLNVQIHKYIWPPDQRGV